jgi:hypothetical protein
LYIRFSTFHACSSHAYRIYYTIYCLAYPESRLLPVCVLTVSDNLGRSTLTDRSVEAFNIVETRSGSNAVGLESSGNEQALGARDVPEQPASSTPFANNRQETQQERYDRLIGQVTAKRQEQAIIDIEIELVGESSTNLVKIARLPIRHKRLTLTTLVGLPPPPRMPRLADPPYYEAKSIRDVSKYEAR